MTNTLSLKQLPEPLIEANGYYSLEDAQRMQAMARALLQGNRPVALSSASSEALEHYSRLFVRDLRQLEGVKVVAHLAGSTDKLVQQVNDLLADQPLAQVIARNAPLLQPTRVFVVHDSPQLSGEEFALLLRLVNDLPGANLRIVLIQERDPAVTGNLQALGPHALHWRVHVPGLPTSARQEASRAALQQALQESSENLPPWALTPDKKAKRRRWRLAFWRRDKPASDKPTKDVAKVAKAAKPVPSAARAGAPARGHARPASRHAATASARSAAAAKSHQTARPLATSPARGAAKNAQAHSPSARRNRMVLVSGVILSAILASALGTWLSMQPSAQRAARSATLPAAAPSATTTAAVWLPSRP